MCVCHINQLFYILVRFSNLLLLQVCFISYSGQYLVFCFCLNNCNKLENVEQLLFDLYTFLHRIERTLLLLVIDILYLHLQEPTCRNHPYTCDREKGRKHHPIMYTEISDIVLSSLSKTIPICEN